VENKFYQVVKRSLELISQQITEIENKIPIKDLQKIRTLQENDAAFDEIEKILSKHLTESEIRDLSTWVMMKYPVRSVYKDFLPESEKKKLENTVTFIESLLSKKKCN
jgi:hypothetical protein